jgi:hypothetical protein
MSFLVCRYEYMFSSGMPITRMAVPFKLSGVIGMIMYSLHVGKRSRFRQGLGQTLEI